MPKKSTTKKKATVKPVEDAALTLAELNALNTELRIDNLNRKKLGQSYGKSFAVVNMKKSKKQLDPITLGLGDRSKVPTPTLMGGFVPFLDSKGHYDGEDAINTEDLPALEKKIRKKIENEKDYLNSYYGHYGTILPEYDQYEPFTMLDTESYLMQAIRRKHSLMFRQGFKIEGENKRFTNYINSRLNTIGYLMGTTLENFVKDILWNLIVISNCFLLKIRDEDASAGVANPKNNNRVPVAGYMILPPHSVFPFVNQRGEIIKWRRYYGSARKYKDYKLEDVIHFKWDVKPGHIYGTPRTVSVRDDIFALRRLEENVEMLLINHLFPLFHVQVGSKEAPATMLVDGITEVDLIKAELENMPKEGVFVTDERVAVNVVGIKGEAPDPQDIMQHYKARIFTGLGVSSIDMGETDTGNRATAENVSQNLKDTVKADLSWFSGQFKMLIMKEMFEESGQKLSVQNALNDVELKFPDVDVDGHIKWQNHVLEMFNNHLLTEPEARKDLQRLPYTKSEEKLTHYELHVKDLQQSGILLKNKGMIEAMSVRGDVAAGKAKAPGSKASKGAKSVANKNRPANQHGRNLDPHSARSSMDPNLIYDLLVQDMEIAKADTKTAFSSAVWQKRSAAVVDKYLLSLTDSVAQEDLAQIRQQLIDRIGTTTDPDMLSVLIQDLMGPSGLEVIEDLEEELETEAVDAV